jgi:hypothetical protein
VGQLHVPERLRYNLPEKSIRIDRVSVDGGKEETLNLVPEDHQLVRCFGSVVRFGVPQHWSVGPHKVRFLMTFAPRKANRSISDKAIATWEEAIDAVVEVTPCDVTPVRVGLQADEEVRVENAIGVKRCFVRPDFCHDRLVIRWSLPDTGKLAFCYDVHAVLAGKRTKHYIIYARPSVVLEDGTALSSDQIELAEPLPVTLTSVDLELVPSPHPRLEFSLGTERIAGRRIQLKNVPVERFDLINAPPGDGVPPIGIGLQPSPGQGDR